MVKMYTGFYTILAAQFFSSLADNALLIVSISILYQLNSPIWMIPLLKLFFTLSYIFFAPFVGSLSDSKQKKDVMFVSNAIKTIGCVLILLNIHPLFGYTIVGFGAATYSPAKYGILTELLPAEKLVLANGWMEGLTIISIIFGTALGSVLISNTVMNTFLNLSMISIVGIDTISEFALIVISFIYCISAIFNLNIQNTIVSQNIQKKTFIKMIKYFSHCSRLLWTDHLGQISLSVTTLFWGIGAVLQFIVLKWADHVLNMNLSQGAILQIIIAFGVVTGAISASILVPLKKSINLLPYGIFTGILIITVSIYHKNIIPNFIIDLWFFTIYLDMLLIYVLLFLIGYTSGYFIVPMNALLQHRGYTLLSSGYSIAVQNFNENISILFMLAIYVFFLWCNIPIKIILGLFGCITCLIMIKIIKKHQKNKKKIL